MENSQIVAQDPAGPLAGNAIRTAVRVVAIMVGVFVLCLLTWIIVYDPTHRPWITTHQYPLIGIDLLARFIEVNSARTGNNIYVPFGVEAFTYPPAAIILFLPITYVPFKDAFAAWTLVTMLCQAATYLVVLRATRKGSWLIHIAIAVWACVLTVLIFPPMQYTLAWGQTSTILLLLVVLDLLAVKDRAQGILVGVATALKLYPGVVILFWLGRQQWRQAVTAISSFLLVTAVAWVVWPKSSSWFFSHVVLGGQEVDRFGAARNLGLSSSPLTVFLRMTFLPHSLAEALGSAACVVIALVGIWVAMGLDRLNRRVTSVVMLLCASVMSSPVVWDHYFTFAALLVFVILEVGLRSASGKVAAIALAIFVYPWPSYTLALHPSFSQDLVAAISRNALFVASLLVIASGWLAMKEARRGLAAPQNGQSDLVGPAPAQPVLAADAPDR